MQRYIGPLLNQTGVPKMKTLSLAFLLLLTSVVFARGTVTHPVANLEVQPPTAWTVSYCTISGPASAYSWATPTNGEICHFSYLNYAGTYMVTVYEESPTRGPITTEQVVINALPPGQPVPTVIVKMDVD
jgi:hypothetical protein